MAMNNPAEKEQPVLKSKKKVNGKPLLIMLLAFFVVVVFAARIYYRHANQTVAMADVTSGPVVSEPPHLSFDVPKDESHKEPPKNDPAALPSAPAKPAAVAGSFLGASGNPTMADANVSASTAAVPAVPLSVQRANRDPTPEELLQARYSASSLVVLGKGDGADKDKGGGSKDDAAYKTVFARELTGRSHTIYASTAISIVLDSGLTGAAGAAIGHLPDDVWSDDNHCMLIPKGTRLLGNIDGAKVGDRTVQVHWKRIISNQYRMDNITSGSYSADGVPGLPGVVDTRFWERFGAALQLNLASDFATSLTNRTNGNNNQITYNNTSGSLNDAARIAAEAGLTLSPIILVPRGTEGKAILETDIVFPSEYCPKMNRF